MSNCIKPKDGTIWSRFSNTSGRAGYKAFCYFFAKQARYSHGPRVHSIDNTKITLPEIAAVITKGEARVTRHR